MNMTLFSFAAVVLVIYMTSIFIVALIRKDNSVVDIAYGLAFVVVCWAAVICYGIDHFRQYLLLTLITFWGVRLALHISFRKRGEKGEDFRYRQWRDSWGKTFVWRSFLQIFMLQGAVVFLVMTPVLLVFHNPGGGFGLLDLVGLLVWLIGFGFEAVGDWQLLKFKNDPGNKGKIMQRGLWRYTRHPNYFGEAVLWWGVFLIAVGVPYGMFAVVSPLLIGFLLLKVSGIPMLEVKYEGNPEFESYKQRTNAFFPWFAD